MKKSLKAALIIAATLTTTTAIGTTVAILLAKSKNQAKNEKEKTDNKAVDDSIINPVDKKGEQNLNSNKNPKEKTPTDKNVQINFVFENEVISSVNLTIPSSDEFFSLDQEAIPTGYFTNDNLSQITYHEVVNISISKIPNKKFKTVNLEFRYSNQVIKTETFDVENSIERILLDNHIPSGYQLLDENNNSVNYTAEKIIVEIVPLTKKSLISFVYDANVVGNFEIEIPFKKDSIDLSLITLPNGYRLKNEITSFTYQPQLNLEVAPINKQIVVNFKNGDLKVGEIVISIPFENTTFTIDQNQIPEGYQTNDSLIDILYAQTIEIRVNSISRETQDEIMQIHFVYQNELINKFEIIKKPNQSDVDLNNFVLKEGYQINRNQARNIPFTNGTVQINVVPLTKNAIIVFEHQGQKISQISLNIDYYDNKLTIPQDQIPQNYKAVSTITDIPYASTLTVQVNPLTKKLIIKFMDENNLIKEINEDINYEMSTINLTNLIPENYKLKDESQTSIPYQNGEIIIEVVSKDARPDKNPEAPKEKETNDPSNSGDSSVSPATNDDNQPTSDSGDPNPGANNSQAKIQEIRNWESTILSVKNNLASHFDNNEALKNSLENIDFNNLESKSEDDLNLIKAKIDETIAKANSIIDQKINDVNTKYETFKDDDYYFKDFEGSINSLLSIKNQTDFKVKINDFNTNYNTLLQLPNKINEFKTNSDSITLDVRDKYKLYLKFSYPKEGSGSYLIGNQNSFEVKVTLKEASNPQNSYELKYLYKLLKTNQTAFEYKLTRIPRSFSSLVASNINYETSALTIPFDSVSGNDDAPLKLRLKTQVTDFKDETYPDSSNIFIRRGEMPDLTPSANSIVTNSLDDYWLFPRRYKIQFRKEIIDFNKTAVQTRINNEQQQGAWNNKISDNTPFSYKDAVFVTLMKVILESNFSSEYFTIDPNQTIFTKPFDSKGNFEFQIKATVQKEYDTRTKFNNLGGSFFDFSLIDKNIGVKHQILQPGQQVVMTFSLENSLNESITIANNKGEILRATLTETFKGENLSGRNPIVGEFSGLFRMKLSVDGQLVWNTTTAGNDITGQRSNQSRTLPIFALQKIKINEIPELKVLVY
ncbi:hypothetical protein [Mycoplasmopsis glycophila]|uniref:Uncharacterized protein n=1 Tax=Mycoplasmopsis glycophila TaxID=171285 RepID=A0A449AV04_9BACT|nr:hypothetical protein [Mycoplasmopsis glycophila]VEU70300.1 Uncharacterised protein [Mycoplasmopsis glycophila]